MASSSCPICGIAWPATVACCPCGFTPARGDAEALELLEDRIRIVRRRAFGRQVVGAAMCSSLLPFMWLIGLDGAWWLVSPLIAGLLVGGTIHVLRGTGIVAQCTQRLRAARELRRLPVARVLESKP